MATFQLTPSSIHTWWVGGNSSGSSRLAAVTSTKSGSPSCRYVSVVPHLPQKALLTSADERYVEGSPEVKETDYELNTEGDKLQILDGKGKAVAWVGEEVSVGGGEVGVQRVIVDARTAHELRNRCSEGGYWIVTGVEAHTVPNADSKQLAGGCV